MTEKQKKALARQQAIVDAARAARILDRVRDLGVPVLLASHDSAVLARADRVIALSGPPLRRENAPDSIRTE